jgi:hypothetical protein
MQKTFLYLTFVLLSGCVVKEKKESSSPQQQTSHQANYKLKYDSLNKIHQSFYEDYKRVSQEHNALQARLFAGEHFNQIQTSDKSLLKTGGKNLPGYKLLFENLDHYEGPEIQAGEKFWGVFSGFEDGDRQTFNLREVSIKDVDKELLPPITLDSADRGAVFYFKGINPAQTDISGKEFKESFFLPGRIEYVALENKRLVLYADGKYKKKRVTDGYTVFGGIEGYELRMRVLDNDIMKAEYPLVAKTNYQYHDIRTNDEVELYVVWVGDLDGDNDPDILAGDGFKSCVTLTLFLSSAAKKGLPFAPVASLANCGC